MIPYGRILLTLIFIAGIIIPAASAIQVHDLTVFPDDPYIPGSSIVVTIPITLESNGFATFDENHKIQFITDLDSPEWSWDVHINGRRHAGPKSYSKTFQLSNWDITYREIGIAESVVVSLEGKAPEVSSTQNINIVDIQELESDNTPLRQYQEYGLVGLKTDIINAIQNLNVERANLKVQIDNQSKIGGDLGNAIGDYDDSGTKISLATRLLDGLTAKQYKIAMEDLEIANIEIRDGFEEVQKVRIDVVFEKAYDYRIGAETCLKNVTSKINRTEYDNGEYQKILEEISNNENTLNIAGDMKNHGKYDQSYALAIQAREQFNKTLSRAEAFEKDSKPGLKAYLLPALLIATIICAAVIGNAIYRKRKQVNDEVHRKE